MTAGRGTNPYIPADPPSKPKLPRCLLKLRPPLAEGSKTAEGTQKKAKTGRMYPSTSAEAGFLALTHLPPNAHAGTSAGHR